MRGGVGGVRMERETKVCSGMKSGVILIGREGSDYAGMNCSQ